MQLRVLDALPPGYPTAGQVPDMMVEREILAPVENRTPVA